MPLYMTVFHAGPGGLAPNVPLRWQHGATPGVTVHAAWVSAGQGGTLSTGRTYVVIECEHDGVAAFVNWIRPFCADVEVHPINEYLTQMRAYEAGHPALAPQLANASEEERHAAVEHTKRYIEAATPAEALRIWLETETLPGAGIAGSGGIEWAKSMTMAQRLGLWPEGEREKTG